MVLFFKFCECLFKFFFWFEEGFDVIVEEGGEEMLVEVFKFEEE